MMIYLKEIKIKQISAFSILELVVSLAIVAILATMALSVYREYFVRSKLVEGIGLATSFKVAIGEFYSNEQQFPQDNEAASLASPDAYKTDYVASIEIVDSGTIAIMYDASLTNFTVGKYLYLIPSAMDGSVTWKCSAPDFNKRYLTPECRH